jgi:membrane protein YqaA with SNARE-associated domain
MSAEVLRAISIFFLSATKLLWAPGTAAASGLSFWETIILTATGGMTGILFFYFFGHWIFVTIDEWRAKRRKKEKVKRVFTKKNRMVVNVKSKFGIIGLTFLTPCILSIPIGCVIAAKFYYHNRLTLPLLLIFTVVWSFILSIFVFYIKELVFS